MEELISITRSVRRARWLPLAIILLSLAILAGTIYHGTFRLRESIRYEMINHDGQTLQAAVRMAQIESDPDTDLAQQLENAPGQLDLALKLSRLQEGVLAVRLFDARGRFVAGIPLTATGKHLGADELTRLMELRPVSRFEPAGSLEDFLLPGAPAATPGHRVPLHFVVVPLFALDQKQLLAAAQFVLDGRDISEEFARLDRALWRQAALAYLVSGGLLATALAWAFRRLRRIHFQLAEQTSSLRRANQELVMAAKTSALGAVTAHLMHGLTSPLAGLHNFVAAHASDDAESAAAFRSAERLQTIVSETVKLLAEEDGDLHYEVPLSEMMDCLLKRVQAAAQSAGVNLEAHVAASAVLSNRDAQLLALILENLLRNALEATPAGGTVRLSAEPADEGLLFTVSDQGPGLPAVVREALFTSCRSTKPGGHGIGLAISRQLARHLGSELDLVQNGPSGCTFALRFPACRLTQAANAAQSRPTPITP